MKRTRGIFPGFAGRVGSPLDLRLWPFYLADYALTANLFVSDIIFAILNLTDPIFHHGLSVSSVKYGCTFPYNAAQFFAFKFVLSMGFLILCRGGTPRYRYDYLTKLGWLKFLGLIILVFFASVLVYFVY